MQEGLRAGRQVHVDKMAAGGGGEVWAIVNDEVLVWGRKPTRTAARLDMAAPPMKPDGSDSEPESEARLVACSGGPVCCADSERADALAAHTASDEGRVAGKCWGKHMLRIFGM